MADFLTKDEGARVYTSARDRGDGKPVTDVHLTGSYTRLSTEPKPTAAADRVKDGNSLTLVDTGQVFKYYQSKWWEL